MFKDVIKGPASDQAKEALQLTRAGRLGEAAALLRGAFPAPPANPAPPGAKLAGWPAGRWRLPDGSQGLGASRSDASRFEPPGDERPGAGRFTTHLARCAQGERRYKLYLPRSYQGAPLPLLVMLHGCTQSPDDFAAGSGMNAVADEFGIAVAYPEQTRTANASKCWNWFRPGDQGRGGEPAIIAAMVDEIAEQVAVDRARVFAAGLSAGGAAAAVLGQSFPEVFAAVGVHSGLRCGAAHDLPSALQAMKGAPAAAPTARPLGRRVRTIVFHGSADRTVAPGNAQVLLREATAGLPAPAVERGRSPGGVAYERAVYRDGGRVAAESWALEGVGHAWSGGSVAGSYTDPRGPDASRLMVRFFLGRG